MSEKTLSDHVKEVIQKDKLKRQTIVIVEEDHLVKEQYDYFFELLNPLLTRAFISRENAVIDTEDHRIRIMPKRLVGRGLKADYCINLTKQDTFMHGNFEYPVWAITMNRR
jgi:hypothetical protein